MSTIDPERELQRLAEVYSNQADDELLQVAQNRSALTQIAQRALDDELQRRRLTPSVATSSDEVEFREMVTIAKFRDLPEALLAQGNLNSSGIESVLLDDNLVRLDWLWSNAVGGIKLQVKAEDADEATEILNQPIPETIEFGGAGDYRQPECPKCKSLDVTFQEIYKPVATGVCGSVFHCRCIAKLGNVVPAAMSGKTAIPQKQLNAEVILLWVGSAKLSSQR